MNNIHAHFPVLSILSPLQWPLLFFSYRFGNGERFKVSVQSLGRWGNESAWGTLPGKGERGVPRVHIFSPFPPPLKILCGGENIYARRLLPEWNRGYSSTSFQGLFPSSYGRKALGTRLPLVTFWNLPVAIHDIHVNEQFFRVLCLLTPLKQVIAKQNAAPQPRLFGSSSVTRPLVYSWAIECTRSID